MPRVESHSAPQIHSSSQGPDTKDPGQNNDINGINESYFVKCFSCVDLKKKNTCEHCVCAAWMPASANASCLWQGLVGLFQLIQLWPEGSHLPHPWTTTTSLWSFHTQFLSVPRVFFSLPFIQA